MKDFPFVRIDLYEVNGKIYFGKKITFYPISVKGVFILDRWNNILGKLIHLPEKDSYYHKTMNM